MPDPAGRLCGFQDTAVHHICVQDPQGHHQTCHVRGHRRDFEHAAGQAGCWWDGAGHPRTNQLPPRHHMWWDLGHVKTPPGQKPLSQYWPVMLGWSDAQHSLGNSAAQKNLCMMYMEAAPPLRKLDDYWGSSCLRSPSIPLTLLLASIDNQSLASVCSIIQPLQHIPCADEPPMGLKDTSTLARSATYWLTLSLDKLRSQCCSTSANRLTAMAQAALFKAMQKNVLYGLYVVWLLAGQAYAILPVMARLVLEFAVALP